MNIAAWEDLWRSAVALFAREPIEFRIGAALVAAFLALMVLEGLRASFIPRRTKTELADVVTNPSSQKTSLAAEPQAGSASTKVFAVSGGNTAPHAEAPIRKFAQHNRKRKRTTLRAHRNMLPKIQRMVRANTQDPPQG